MANGEIIIVPFHSSGHIFPATQLAHRLASRDYRITLLLPSAPSSASLHPLIQIVEYSMPHPPGPPPPLSSCTPPGPHSRDDDCSHFRDLLAKRSDGGNLSPPVCAIVDVMMSQLLDVCKEFGVTAVSLFTSSACSTAMEHAVPKLSTADLGSGGSVMVPGLPEEMALTAADLMHQGPPPPPFRPGHLDSGEDETGAHRGGPLPPPVRPPPPMPSHHGRPPPPLAPHFGPQHVPPPFGDEHRGGSPPPWRPAPPPPPPFQPGHGCAPPPSPRECHGRGPTPPPPFAHGHPARPPPPHGAGVPGCPPPPLPGSGPAPPPPPFDHQHRGGGPPRPPFQLGESGGPTPPGPPQGLAETEGAVALLFNTCDDLERPFLDYIANEAKKPAWGVGPLLPSQFWSAAGSVLHDDAIRSKGGGGGDDATTVTEADVLQFLDSKPRGSVIYVSFGSLVVPSDAELAELASALEESTRPFIWALQRGAMRHDADGRPVEGGGGSGYFPEGLAERTGGRGLVIHGWAPQLLILSHPATGGFVTHCGWNSTLEALGRGIPVLAWPVHGDQIWNAKLVARRLKTGLEIKDGGGAEGAVTRAQVAEGIERLMANEGMRERAAGLARELFAGGFPASSEAALDALLDFVAERRPRK